MVKSHFVGRFLATATALYVLAFQRKPRKSLVLIARPKMNLRSPVVSNEIAVVIAALQLKLKFRYTIAWWLNLGYE